MAKRTSKREHEVSSTPERSRVRKDRRREATRMALIQKGEELIARYGVDAVSLRQIGTSIGSSNSNVVPYYFGDKDGLIRAIFAQRLPWLEARRAELFAKISQDGLGHDVAALTNAQWQPLYEITNDEGQHTFAGFMSSLGRTNWMLRLLHVDEAFPVTSEILRRLRAHMPKASDRIFYSRLLMCCLIVTGSLEHIDSTCSGDSDLARSIFEDAVRMTAAAFEAELD